MAWRRVLGGALSVLLGLVGCGSEASPDAATDAAPDAPETTCEVLPFEAGDEGHADPLGVGAGEARAGRLDAADLPAFESGLEVWEGGDFVLANEHVAMVIEDARVSELYDPWGGRPAGVARVEGGALVDPADFGEILVLIGRYTVLTERVTVLADGSDGGAAVIRAEGPLRPLPFFETVVGSILNADFSSVHAAIDYTLEPGARHVDVHLQLRSGEELVRGSVTLHAFMHTPRMPPFGQGVGFDVEDAVLPWVGFADEGTSFAYIAPDLELGAGFEVSGFVSFLTAGFSVSTCSEITRHHARIVIGGPGVSGLTDAVLETIGEDATTVSGTVRDASGDPAADTWVLAEDDAGGFLSRARTDESGAYAITLPADASASLVAFRQGDAVAAAVPVTGASHDLALPEGGFVHVTATEDGSPVPARVQLLPMGGDAPRVDGRFGVPRTVRGRIQVDYPEDGDTTLRAPAGMVRVVVSRGFEYELVEQTVEVVEGETVDVAVALERVIDTPNTLCGDFHIHTHRSNDSGDDGELKLRSAVADGIELPVRSEHEFISTFQPEIEALGLTDFALGIGSIEMTSFESWGHMGMVPLSPDPTARNAGAPEWQRYPTMDDPDRPIEMLTPPEVFDAARARASAPLVIINHPRGGANYFDYVGYDPLTGTVEREEAWDETFRLVEVFNSSDWISRQDREVRDWLGLLNMGRRVFAVGSSDSHSIAGSPVGYPRTCIDVGTDVPSEASAELIRAGLDAGHSTVSGGIFVDARVGGAGPGDDATGLGATAMVDVTVQAANWVDLDRVDVVVDGEIVERIDVTADDGDPLDTETRFVRTIEVDVAASGTTYMIIAAYGDAPLEPVHPGRIPFGVANPIFLSR